MVGNLHRHELYIWIDYSSNGNKWDIMPISILGPWDVILSNGDRFFTIHKYCWYEITYTRIVRSR
jgi:hypothetical protein